MATDVLGPHGRSPAELKALLAAQRLGQPFVEYRDGDGGQVLLTLDGSLQRLGIGRLPSCEIALGWDSEASRAHALLEQVGGAWTIEDRGSSNGTLVNTVRIPGPVVLHDGDVVQIGRTRIVFHAGGGEEMRRTTPAGERPAPALTESQRKVLVELCRPVLERNGAPAANRDVAAALVVSVDTVKTHMRALFDAFAVGDVPQYHKRTELARRALETGVVTPHDLER